MVVQDLAAQYEALAFENVQQFVLQPDPDKAIAIVPYGSVSPTEAFGTEVPTHESPRVQVQVRGEPNDPEEPGTRAYALWKATPKQMVQLASGALYRHLKVLTSPVLLKQDAQKRWVWTFNVEAWKEVE